MRRVGIGLVLVGLAAACLFWFLMPETLRKSENATPPAPVAAPMPPPKPLATEPGSLPGRAADPSRLHGHGGEVPRSSGPAARWP